MSKEIVDKIKAAEAEAKEIRRSAEVKAREIKAAAEAEAEQIVKKAEDDGEKALSGLRAEQKDAADRAVEEGRKNGAYEAARATSEAGDNLEAAVSYIIKGLVK